MVVAVEVVSVGSQAGVERKAEVGSGMVSGVVEAVAAGHGGGGDGGGGGERRRGGPWAATGRVPKTSGRTN